MKFRLPLLVGMAALAALNEGVPVASAEAAPPGGTTAAAAGASGASVTSEPQPTAAPSGQPNAAPAKKPWSEYAWPKETSPEPKEEEWAGAMALATSLEKAPVFYSPGELSCLTTVVREWVRLACAPVGYTSEETYIGVIWGLAGDVSAIKASIELAGKVSPQKFDLNDQFAALTSNMGVSAVLTFQAKAGSAQVFQFDKMGWSFTYGGAAEVMVSEMLRVDVSWALGEAGPHIYSDR